mgnify:CR=1 FL=1
MRKIFHAALLISILLVDPINGFSEEKSTHVSEAFKYSAQAAKNLIYSIGHSAAASGYSKRLSPAVRTDLTTERSTATRETGPLEVREPSRTDISR